MPTYSEVMSNHNDVDVEIPAHLMADAEVPILSGEPQRQGDVYVVPMRAGSVSNLKPLPAEGVVIARGGAGGNTHLLFGGGKWAPNTSEGAVRGTLVVEDAPAFLDHCEHGLSGIGRGTYIIRRQREQADEIRLVAD